MALNSILEFFVTHVWTTLGIVGLLLAINMFRNRIRWGAARYMGVTATIFGWMVLIYWLVIFEGAYGIASLILDWPLWIDIFLFFVILGLALFVYFKLFHRNRFKPQLFATMFLLPLSIPGIHTAGKLLPKIPAVGTIADDIPTQVGGKRFPQTVRVAESGYVVLFPNSHSKGRMGDALTAKRLTGAGYRKLPSKISEIHGIDGVYVRYGGNGKLQGVLIVENKVDSASLAPGQMTKEWISGRVRKMLDHSNETVRQTGEIVQGNPDMVRKELWHHDMDSGTTIIYSLNDAGKRQFERKERFLGKQIRTRCESNSPTISCTRR